jgi:hypothetical protein
MILPSNIGIFIGPSKSICWFKWGLTMKHLDINRDSAICGRGNPCQRCRNRIVTVLTMLDLPKSINCGGCYHFNG